MQPRALKIGAFVRNRVLLVEGREGAAIAPSVIIMSGVNQSDQTSRPGRGLSMSPASAYHGQLQLHFPCPAARSHFSEQPAAEIIFVPSGHHRSTTFGTRLQAGGQIWPSPFPCALLHRRAVGFLSRFYRIINDNQIGATARDRPHNAGCKYSPPWSVSQRPAAALSKRYAISQRCRVFQNGVSHAAAEALG